jgi:8-oxo-dGTP pyrophosphatase MutT (NUDIX family)
MPSLTLERLKARLSPAQAHAPAPDLVPAGVLAPLFVEDGQIKVLLLQRSLMVRDHRGQMAFPGGVRDPEDPHLLATALRETEEELGLPRHWVDVLGAIKPVNTLTGYHITAYVGLIPCPYPFQPNPHEVKRLLTLPLKELTPPSRWGSGAYEFKGKILQVCYWRSRQEVIWGATARILLHLLALLGRHPLGLRTESPCPH